MRSREQFLRASSRLRIELSGMDIRCGIKLSAIEMFRLHHQIVGPSIELSASSPVIRRRSKLAGSNRRRRNSSQIVATKVLLDEFSFPSSNCVYVLFLFHMFPLSFSSKTSWCAKLADLPLNPDSDHYSGGNLWKINHAHGSPNAIHLGNSEIVMGS